MFSSKKKNKHKPAKSDSNGVGGLDGCNDVRQKVMSRELDPTSSEVMSALGIREFDATALENDTELLSELASICRDDGIDIPIQSRASCKESDNSSFEIKGSDDECGGDVDEEELCAQLAAMSDGSHDEAYSEEENSIGTAQDLSMDDDEPDTITCSYKEEDNRDSLEEAGKRAATSAGTSDKETELLKDRVLVMKQEAHALYSRGDKKGALTKLRECKAIEHELVVDRALNTARDLAAPPVIKVTTPPEETITAKDKLLSGQSQQLSSRNVIKDQNLQHQHQLQQQKLERKQQQSDQAAMLREVKIKAMRMHRTGDKAKAIALLKGAKSIENRLQAQDPNEQDSPALRMSQSENSSLSTTRRISSAGYHGGVTRSKYFDDNSTFPFSVSLDGSFRRCISEDTHTRKNKSSVFDAFVVALETALETHYAKAKTLLVDDRLAAKKELKKCKPLEAHLEKARKLRSIPGASPPPWGWHLIQKQRPKVIASVKEDEVQLEIESADGMQVDGGYISVQYDLGYIRGDEAVTCQGSTDSCVTLEKQSANSGRGVQLDYRMAHPLARTSRATQLAFRNRKASFEVFYRKRKGWLAPKPELFGKAVLPLASLLNSCELEETLRLRGGHRASSLAVLHVKLSVRTPLSGPELILSEEKQLSVGDWPSLIHETVEDCPIQHTTTPLARNNNEEDQNSSSNLKGTGKSLEPQHTPRTTSGGPDYSILTEQEKCTPFAPECIDSNDVLELEIAANQNATDTPSVLCQSGLVLKQQCLISAVQEEELSMEKYCEILNERMSRDKILALWLKTNGRVDEAIRVMGRIRVMEKELASADG